MLPIHIYYAYSWLKLPSACFEHSPIYLMIVIKSYFALKSHHPIWSFLQWLTVCNILQKKQRVTQSSDSYQILHFELTLFPFAFVLLLLKPRKRGWHCRRWNEFQIKVETFPAFSFRRAEHSVSGHNQTALFLFFSHFLKKMITFVSVYPP